MDGSCLVCIPDYYLNSKTKKCIKATLIENCFRYGIDSTCIACNRDYYLKEDKTCNPVEILIKSCSVYWSEDTCSVCENNQLLSLDYRLCEYTSEDEHCLYYTPITCNKCKPGYVFNKNYFIDSFYQFVDEQSKQDF